jgi:hypothetical protein
MQYLVNFNARWSAEYDYDYVRDCSTYGCDSICRCGRYENLRVTAVTPSVANFEIERPYKDKAGRTRKKAYAVSTIESYCIDRLLRIFKAYDPSLYTVSTSSGYYGEEIDGIHFDQPLALCTAVQQVLLLEKDVDKVKFVLQQEYQFLLPQVKAASRVDVRVVELSQVGLNEEYASRLKKDALAQTYAFADEVPVGILRKVTGGFMLVDGYHRFHALLQGAVKSASFIVLEV